MINWKNRTYCGNVSPQAAEQSIHLFGWVDTVRDHGGVIFLHLRDISGGVQIVFNPQNAATYEIATQLRSEFAVEVVGKVALRTAENINPAMKTGSVEVVADSLHIFSKSKTPPFLVTEKESAEGPTEFKVDEDLRLKYRYLDIRRPSMQQNLLKRSQVMKQIRDYFYENAFHEIETPVLTKSTPEGARDYLVPSRVHEGQFYALPQSPQLFKQLLMVAGMDRYFQIVKCFRDEDLRPNRQPEFTQVDLEASFIDETFVMSLIETLIVKLFAAQGITLPQPFPVLSYDDAMNTYGSDAPDMRFGMEMITLTPIFKNSDYKILQSISTSGGAIKGMVVKGKAEELSKNLLQNTWAKEIVPKFGGKGMTWMKMENGELSSNIVQFLSDAEKAELIAALKPENGDVVLIIADMKLEVVNDVCGKLRLYAAETLKLIPQNVFKPCWIVDFPLFEFKSGRLYSCHHPFTSPKEDILNLSKPEDFLAVKANAYDIVVNGQELGGGSIRIHDQQVQRKVFEALGFTDQQIQDQFGFFVEGLQYGTPPHGGLALGLDRLVAMLLGTESIREVIAFPKNRVAWCPLTQAPSFVDPDQLKELHLNPAKPKAPQ